MEVVYTYLGRMSSSHLMFYTVAFITAVCGQDSDSRIQLTSEPKFATEGELFTLSCRDSEGVIGTARWYRNCTEVFQTSIQTPKQTLHGSNGKIDRNIADRITVDANSTSHNIMLVVDSTLDEGSKWSCRNDKESSHELTICFSAKCTDSSDRSSTIPMTKCPTTSTASTTDEQTKKMTTMLFSSTTVDTKEGKVGELLLHVIIGCVAGLAFIICVVVTVGFVCVRRMTGGRANGKQMKHEEGPEDQGTGPPANAVGYTMSLNEYTYCESVGATPYRKEIAEMVDNVCYNGGSDSDVSETSYWEYNGPVADNGGI